MEKRLRFIEAKRARAGRVRLADAEVMSVVGTRLGALDGFILDPVCGRVRFVVVDTGRWPIRHKYLVPLDAIRLDPDHEALLVDLAPELLSRYPEFRSGEVPTFSDDDLVTAVFRHTAA